MFLELLMLHTIACGISLFGGLLMWQHRATFSKLRLKSNLEAVELKFYEAQYRRRMQASGMITLVGVLLNISNEHLVPWQRAPLAFTIYVLVMFAIVAWIVMLAIGDWAAARLIHTSALMRLEEQRRHLEREMKSMRQESNRGTVVESTGVIRRN